MNSNTSTGLIMMVPFVIYIIALSIVEIQFGIDIKGHMKRAADANTVDLAIQEMEIVVKNMEKRGLTEGYTSIIYRTPDEDVGFWYDNMKNSLGELKSLPESAQPLEKSNVLIKLRETLLDSGTVTVPQGSARFPYNGGWAIILWATFVMFFTGLRKTGFSLD